MANHVQFFLDDTSPSISYQPFRDTFDIPNVEGGWNPIYTNTGFTAAPLTGVRGEGSSFHVTSRPGASLTIVWVGTGIQLHGNATGSDSYSVTLDGTTPPQLDADITIGVLANLKNLPNVKHTLTLTALVPEEGKLFWFDGATILADSARAPQPSKIDDNHVAYHGKWSYESDGVASYHKSGSMGDKAVTSFRGTTLFLVGETSPQAGNYSITIDNETVSYSAKSSFLKSDSLLHYSLGLDPDVIHNITVTNEGGGTLSLLDGGFGIYASDGPLPPASFPPAPTASPSSQPTPYPKGTIAAFVMIGILSCILISAGLYFWCIYRPRKQAQQAIGRVERTSESKSNSHHGHISVRIPQLPSTHDFDYTAEGRRNHPSLSVQGSHNGSYGPWKTHSDDDGGVQFASGSAYKESDNADDRSSVSTVSSESHWSSRPPSFARNTALMAGGGTPSRRSSMDMDPMRIAASRSPIRSRGPSYPNLPQQAGFSSEEYASNHSRHLSNDTHPSTPGPTFTVSSGSPVMPTFRIPSPTPAHTSHMASTPSSFPATPSGNAPGLSVEDRGSIMENTVDRNSALLSGPAVLEVIRSLSPRTSTASVHRTRTPSPVPPCATPTLPRSTPSPRPPQSPQPLVSDLIIPSAVPSPTSSFTKDFVVPGHDSDEPISPSTEDASHSHPPVRNPFRSSGTFGTRRTSYTIADVDIPSPLLEEGAPPVPPLPAFVAQPLPAVPKRLVAPEARSSSVGQGGSSFLDFTSSSDGSTYTRSSDAHRSRDSRQDSVLSMPPPPLPSSEGATTPAASSSTQPPRLPPLVIAPKPSFVFPKHLTRLSANSGSDKSQVSSSKSDPLHVHPSLPSIYSSTDSVPYSKLSEIEFRPGRRGSDSDPELARRVSSLMDSVRNSVSSGYPSLHPFARGGDLPPRSNSASPTRRDRYHSGGGVGQLARVNAQGVPSGLTSPNYLVQRVLGYHSPASSIGSPRPHPYSAVHSRTPSGLASAPWTPARFEMARGREDEERY